MTVHSMHAQKHQQGIFVNACVKFSHTISTKKTKNKNVRQPTLNTAYMELNILAIGQKLSVVDKFMTALSQDQLTLLTKLPKG